MTQNNTTPQSDNRDNEGEEEIVYPSKILFFTRNTRQLTEMIHLETNPSINSSCINTIGMYPMVHRVSTPFGQIGMNIWIISSDERFRPFRRAYYTGACHSIIYCDSSEELDNINDFFSIIPDGIPITIIQRDDEINIEMRDEEVHFLNQNLAIGSRRDNELPNRQISLKKITSVSELNSAFKAIGYKIASDIFLGEFYTIPSMTRPVPLRKNRITQETSIKKIRKIISRLGYQLDNNWRVKINKGEFIFTIDFYKNYVTAIYNNCFRCEKSCKCSRKLCVIEEDKGYSNLGELDNLRALAILYSIHDGDFLSLTGKKRREDIVYQLERLKKAFEYNCPYHKEELTIKKIRLRKREPN